MHISILTKMEIEHYKTHCANCQSYSETDQVVKKEGKKKNNSEEKTERKQKGFRLKSETLIRCLPVRTQRND